MIGYAGSVLAARQAIEALERRLAGETTKRTKPERTNNR